MKSLICSLLFLLIAASAFAQGGGASPVLHPAAYAKARLWENIMDHGAKGDGVTDDRAAIQSALDAVGDSGGGVFVPHSDSGFLIKSKLSIKPYTTLFGTGRGSKILADASIDPFTMIENLHADSSSPHDTGIVIDGIFFDGGQNYIVYDSTDSASIVEIRHAHSCVVRNCFFTRSDKDGIGLRQSSDCKILNNYFWEMGEEGIVVSRPIAKRNIVSGNHFTMRDSSYKGLSGLYAGGIPAAILLNANNVTISNNVFRYGGGGIDMDQQTVAPLEVDTAYNIIITNNQFISIQGNNCISPQRPYNITISGNTFFDCNAAGIFCWGPGGWDQGQAGADTTTHDMIITNNHFLNHHKICIFAGSGHGYEITNNVFSDIDTTAIVCAGDRSVITGNRITEVASGYGIHVTAQEHSIISNNQISYVGGSGLRVETFAGLDEYLSINGNTVAYCDLGIDLENVDMSTIIGNVCVDNDSAGIYANNCFHNILALNICTSSPDATQDYGILFEASSNLNMVHDNILGGNTVSAISGMADNLEYGNRLDTAGALRFTFHGNVGIGAVNPQVSLAIDTVSPTIFFNAMDTGGIAAGDCQIRFDSAGSLGFSVVFNASSSSAFWIRNHITTTNPFHIARNAAITFNETYTFPVTDGAAGYVLETNGSGDLSWQPNDTGAGAGGEANTLGDTGTFNGTEGFGLAGGKTGVVLKVKGLIEGTGITIAASGDSALTITAAGGSGAWTTAGDTAHLIDADNDTLARFWDNDAGAVTWDIGADQSTLHIVGKADTGDYLGADTVRVFVTNRVDTLTANMILNGGNIVMSSTELVDGVDVSVHAADEDGHHIKNHNIYGSTDHNASAYRLFYSDASSVVQQLLHGSNGQVLTSNGVSADPTWQAAPGGGGADSAGIYDGNSDHWSVDKAWLWGVGYGLTWTDSLKDSAGILDTGTIIVDTAAAVADAEPLPVTGNAVYDWGVGSPVITTPTLTLKQSASPSPTDEGVIEWGTSVDRMYVGTGGQTSVFYAGAHTTAIWVASNDTMFLIDGDGDTLAALWDDDAGNVGWQVGIEDQTLYVLMDTLTVNKYTNLITGVDIDLNDTDNVTIDARTNPRTVTNGALRLNHTPEASTPGTRAIFIDVDANSVPSTEGMHIGYTATGLADGETGIGIDFVGITSTSTGGSVEALKVTRSGTGLAEVNAVHVSAGIDVIHHEAGSFATPTQAWEWDASLTTWSNLTTPDAVGSAVIDSTLFEEINDYLYVGNTAKFNEIDFVFNTFAGGPGIGPTFEFSIAGPAWTTFPPIDNTDGCRANGGILWDVADLTSWASVTVNGVASYYIRILRNQAGGATNPIESRIQTSATNEYKWDSSGNVTVQKVEADSLFVGTISLADGAGDTSVANFGTALPGRLSGGQNDAQFGNSVAGRIGLGNSWLGQSNDTTFNGGLLNLNQTAFWANMGSPASIEFAFFEANGDGRLVIPTSGAGYAMNLVRSGMCAGPWVWHDSAVIGTYWGFDHLAMNTAVDGADWGVQNNLQTQDTIFIGTGTGSSVDTITSTTLDGYMENEDINTFAELQAWVSDKTLLNDADIATITALWVFTQILRVEADLHTEGNIYINKDSTAADAFLYFQDDDEIVSFHWDDANNQFELSDGLDIITGNLDISSGNITLSGTVDTVDVGALAAKVHNEDLRHFIFPIINPNAVYDTDSIFTFKPVTEKAITITRIDVTCDADPATEPAMKLNHTDNFISRTSPTTIDVITTTAGVTTITSGFDDATIPASRCIYFAFTADPIAAIKSITVDITYTID